MITILARTTDRTSESPSGCPDLAEIFSFLFLRRHLVEGIAGAVE